MKHYLFQVYVWKLHWYDTVDLLFAISCTGPSFSRQTEAESSVRFDVKKSDLHPASISQGEQDAFSCTISNEVWKLAADCN